MDNYSGVTTIHPVGLLALAILGTIMIVVKKNKALLPIFILACFVSSAQRIVVAGVDFNFIRMMVVFGTIRVMLRNEHLGFKWELGDKLMVSWAICKTILHTIQQHGAISATIYQLGNAFETLGIYFLTRILIRSIDDVKSIVKVALLVSLPIAACFYIESSTGRNFFSFLGGVPAFSLVRDGRVRSTGAFSHPILAGSFFASLIPMVLALVRQDKRFHIFPVLGILSIFAIIFFCASSTPILGILFAFIGMFFFVFRYRMKIVQQFLVTGLICLDIVMKAPLWHLLSRIDVAGGSTGYFRYLLIDKAVKHLADWVLVGVPDTGYWSDAGGENMSDIVNQYIFEGVEGGFLTMALFVAVIVVCFAIIGRIIKSRQLSLNDQYLVWSLGASLFTHSLMFLVVSYFGQIVMLWNLLLGIIVSMGAIYLKREESPERVSLYGLSRGAETAPLTN